MLHASPGTPTRRELKPETRLWCVAVADTPGWQILGLEFRDLEESIIEMGHSVIRHGLVRPTRKYLTKYRDDARGGAAAMAQ
jgi:hypothetical protein